MAGGGAACACSTTSRWGPNLVRGFAPAGIGPRDLTQFPFTGVYGDALGGTYYWGASLELQTPLYFLPKDAGIKIAAFADAGSLWNYVGPTTFPATGEVISGNFCPIFGPASQRGAVPGRQRHACSLLGRRGTDLGITVRAAAVRLFVPAVEGTLRPGAAVPLRRRDEILTPPAGPSIGTGMTEPFFFNRGRRAQRARDRALTGAKPQPGRRSRPPHHRDCSARSGCPQRSRIPRQAEICGAIAGERCRRLLDDGTLRWPRSRACQRALRRRALSRFRRGGAHAVSGRTAAVLLVRGERRGGAEL